MRPYQLLLTAIALFIGAWFCLFSVAVQVPPNINDLSDKEGLSAAIMLTVALQAIGILAIACVVVGMLTSIFINPRSFGLRLFVYLASNLMIFISSLLGILVIAGFVYDTIAGIAGIILYLCVIGLLVSATPKRVADKTKSEPL